MFGHFGNCLYFFVFFHGRSRNLRRGENFGWRRPLVVTRVGTPPHGTEGDLVSSYGRPAMTKGRAGPLNAARKIYGQAGPLNVAPKCFGAVLSAEPPIFAMVKYLEFLFPWDKISHNLKQAGWIQT